MRFWALLMVVMFTATAVDAGTQQRRIVHVKPEPRRTQAQDAMFDPNKYAALVMDARTGEIIHSRNADAARYPASLTKMMTLYLLFDAMKQKKLSTKSTLSVSKRASLQPQTNISLRPGERIPVDTAIRALVVRSANDVAVVVAENLGGSVENFAVRMTRTAKSLGMDNTVFKNPHGLPDANQKTTARDMAKLSIALRRDFPEYYHYFSIRQFSWKRVSYYTHNRVMLRYAGADGLKTGFINASGFNVATSVKRSGRTIVAVVFGGRTAAARDNRMISIVENAENVLARRGNQIANFQPRNLPTPRAGSVAAPRPAAPAPKPVVVADRGIVTEQARTVPEVSATQAPVTLAPAPVVTRPADTIIVSSQPPPVVPSKPVEAPSIMVPNAPFAVKTYQEGELTRASAVRPSGDTDTNRWGIQVGAFEDAAQAEQAAQRAYSIAATTLKGANIAVAGAGMAGKTIHRARLENITENQARNACQTLISAQSPCFIYRVN